MQDFLELKTNLQLSYHKGISIEFSTPKIELTQLMLHSIKSEVDRIALNTACRRFTLRENWSMTIGEFKANEELNGEIIIPQKVDNKLVIFSGINHVGDWFFNIFTIGLLHPMGNLLAASIIHEFLYNYGFILIKDGETMKQVEVSRDDADKLYRDIVKAKTGSSFVSLIALFPVRLSWLFGKQYNGGSFNGTPPILAVSILLAILFIVLSSVYFHLFGPLFALICFAYISFYAASVILFSKYKNKFESTRPAEAEKD